MATYSNLYIDQGSNFNATIDLSQTVGTLDLTGYGAAGTIAKSYDGTTKGTFSVNVNSTDTELDLSLTATETAVLKPGRYVYDIIVKSPSDVITRVLEGQLEVTPGVTFDAIAPETGGTPAGPQTIFSFTNNNLMNQDAYAFIELDAPGGILPYYQAETGNTSSITLSVRLSETLQPDVGRVRFFLANQTFIENHRDLHIATYSGSEDHHGLNTVLPSTDDTTNFPTGGLNQGLNTITLSLNSDNEGEFKYLAIAYEDTNVSTGDKSGTFELSELEITASTHPENAANTTTFKEPKQLINTFDDEGTHYTTLSTIKKFTTISTSTGLFKS